MRKSEYDPLQTKFKIVESVFMLDKNGNSHDKQLQFEMYTTAVVIISVVSFFFP